MKRALFLACILLTANAVHAADWAMNLVWSGGGIWTKRFAVAIENTTSTPMLGTPVAVELPNGVPANDGLPAKDLRLTKADGTEIVFGLTPDNKTILIPVEAEPGQTANYYVYFGNIKALPVPDMLEVKLGLVNGDVELGSGRIPEGWTMDIGNATHRNYWVEESPHSGQKCLKTVVASDAQADWTATRQSGIPVVGGAKYRFKAWVRGENVVGRAGWFIHVGNERNSQLINQVINGGTGTFDWTEIVSEFTAPANADTMTVGTVLYGTGTAWFDSASLERLDDLAGTSAEPKIAVGAVENIPYDIIPAETGWAPEYRLNDYICRSTFRIVNSTDVSMENVPVLMTLRGTQAHGLLGMLTDLTLHDGTPVTLLDEENFRLMANISVPAKTVKYFNVYYRFDETKEPEYRLNNLAGTPAPQDSDTAHPELQRFVDPISELPNLVRNGDFEEGTAGWNRNDANPPEGVRYSLERSPELVRFGEQCLRLDVAKGVPTNWRGWTQRIEVKPSHSYLVQGWMRGIDLEPARIHLHFHTADGRFCANGAMSSINQDIAGTTDWIRVTELITTPPDARFMTLHLTANGSGTLLHDNITVVDGLFAEQVDRESYCTTDHTDMYYRFWQVPAVEKIFPQTIYRDRQDSILLRDKYSRFGFFLEAARNEKESLQLAMRCRYAMTVRVAVGDKIDVREAPKHASGFVLDQFEINKVGYVDIDYPSGYYNTTTPKWYRKSPTSAPGSDGWAGLWPDPLLPYEGIFELKSGQTESVWITWTIPKNAPAGIYEGWVRLDRVWDADINNPIHGWSLSTVAPLTIIVRNFTLPDENNLSAIYDVRFGPGGAKYWGGSESAFHKEVVELMTANRLSPDVVIPSPGLSFQDGKPVFDWTEFDKTADWYFSELKIRQVYTPWLLYSFGWGHPPRDFYGERPYPGDWPFEDADFSKIRPEYKEKYQAVLREFWNHITEKGWADKFVLYVSDEPNYWTPEIITQMKAVCEMIHEVDANIPIYCSTWRYIPEWKDSLDVWGIGHYGIVPVETMKEIKAHGSRIWFTTDGMLCLDTPYNAIERLLPYYCYKYGADAYEFWGISWLTYDPYKYGSHAYIHQTSTPGEYYWVRYPNGDGYLLYPPQQPGGKIVTSVRFEQAREGMEDFEYFYMLAQLIEKGKREGRDVTRGEAALAAAMELVDSPTPIGRYSSKILPNPYRLYEVRRQVAEAIEALQ